MKDSSHNILMLDALQVLSSSQVTPGLSMSMRIRPISKSTYRHARRADAGWLSHCWQGQVGCCNNAGWRCRAAAGWARRDIWHKRYCADAGWGCCVAGAIVGVVAGLGSWAGVVRAAGTPQAHVSSQVTIALFDEFAPLGQSSDPFGLRSTAVERVSEVWPQRWMSAANPASQ
jgi:hypothetical protein